MYAINAQRHMRDGYTLSLCGVTRALFPHLFALASEPDRRGVRRVNEAATAQCIGCRGNGLAWSLGKQWEW